jgi:tetratricopeptide (TPR) repeat protein
MNILRLSITLCFVIIQLSVNSQTAEEYYEQAKKIKIETKNDSKQALDLIGLALTLDSRYKDALVLRASIYEDMLKYKEEIADLTTLIQIDSANAEYYKTRAKVFALKKDYENAISDFTTAYDKDTSMIDCILERGKIYMDIFIEKKSQLAFNDYNYCITHGSVTIKSLAYLNRGRLYDNLGNTDKALDDYNTAAKINPLNKEIYLYRGLLKISLNKDGCYDLLKYRDMTGANAQDYLNKYCRQ